jgi:hypothetical protein
VYILRSLINIYSINPSHVPIEEKLIEVQVLLELRIVEVAILPDLNLLLLSALLDLVLSHPIRAIKAIEEHLAYHDMRKEYDVDLDDPVGELILFVEVNKLTPHESRQVRSHVERIHVHHALVVVGVAAHVQEEHAVEELILSHSFVIEDGVHARRR